MDRARPSQSKYAPLMEDITRLMEPVIREVYEKGAQAYASFYRGAEEGRLMVETRLRQDGMSDQAVIDDLSLSIWLEASLIAKQDLVGEDEAMKADFNRAFREMTGELRRIRRDAPNTVFAMTQGLMGPEGKGRS